MGGKAVWLITSSTTWTVPKTGNYYIELYGGRGGAGGLRGGGPVGGSSCQSYDSIVLTAGTQMKITIGTGGKSRYLASYDYESSGSAGTSTSFGSYTIAGGGYSRYYLTGNLYTYSWGAAAGNLCTSGNTITSSRTINPNKGIYGRLYGFGGWADDSNSKDGGDGAVYIKYLGS